MAKREGTEPTATPAEVDAASESAEIPAFLRRASGPSGTTAVAKPPQLPAGSGAVPALSGSPNSSDTPGRGPIDPAALPMPALTRRRLGAIAGLIAAAWVVLAFGRQVGAATAAADRADEVRAANAALRANVERLQQDLARVQDDNFVKLQGRGVGLGGAGEIPFTLAANAPTLAPDAPGSASVRLGAAPDQRAPLDVWLSMLLGPGG